MISLVAFMNDQCNGGQGIYAAFVYTRVPCSYYVEMVFVDILWWGAREGDEELVNNCGFDVCALFVAGDGREFVHCNTAQHGRV
jgi:hypothetical protein